MRNGYRTLLTVFVHRRAVFIPGFLLACLAVFLLEPFLGRDFFHAAPQLDSSSPSDTSTRAFLSEFAAR
jgi:hypothetical protein